MQPPVGVSDRVVLDALLQAFYEVVPLQHRTCCALTARIAHGALARLGRPAQLQACQVWCVTGRHNYAVGFMGKPPRAGKWDGHVVCVAGDWLLDTATWHFQNEFGLAVPSAALTRLFDAPSQVLARLDVGPQLTLWWHRPPGGADLRIPAEPDTLIQPLAERLAREVQTRLDPAH